MSPHSSRSRIRSDGGVSRKLEEVGQEMNSVTTRFDLADFLNDPDNSQRLNGLVEDIRYALVDYQVCTPKQFALLVSNTSSDFFTKRYIQQELSRDCESCSPTDWLFVVIYE